MKINTKIMMLFLTTMIINTSVLAWPDNSNNNNNNSNPGVLESIFGGAGSVISSTGNAASDIVSSPFRPRNNNNNNMNQSRTRQNSTRSKKQKQAQQRDRYNQQYPYQNQRYQR